MVNVIFTALIVLAIVLSLLTIVGLLLWLKGNNFNILLPGLGLIVGFEVVLFALIIIQFLVVLLASFVSSFKSQTFH